MKRCTLPGALALGFLAAAAVLPSQPSLAFEGPWCAVVVMGDDLAQEVCSFDTFGACREEAMRFGTTSFCRQNSRYPGYRSGQMEPGRRNHWRRDRQR
jgi:hypothetical protein